MELLLEKLTVLFLALMNIMMGSNYLGIQRYLLFHKSTSRTLRIIGTLLSMAATTVFLFLAMVFIIGITFS